MPKALATNSTVFKLGFALKRSIALISVRLIPDKLASCSCVIHFAFLYFFTFIPSLSFSIVSSSYLVYGRRAYLFNIIIVTKIIYWYSVVKNKQILNGENAKSGSLASIIRWIGKSQFVLFSLIFTCFIDPHYNGGESQTLYADCTLWKDLFVVEIHSPCGRKES